MATVIHENILARIHAENDLQLSTEIQSDLESYHKALKMGAAEPVEPQLIAARAIYAIADSRAATIVLLDAALTAVNAGDLDTAETILSSGLAAATGIPEGVTLQ